MKHAGITDKNLYIQINGDQIELTLLGRCYSMSANNAELIGTALIQYAGEIHANKPTTPPKGKDE